MPAREAWELMKEPTPLGVEPEYVWRSKRIDALFEAIFRYINAGHLPPKEWVSELRELWASFKGPNTRS